MTFSRSYSKECPGWFPWSCDLPQSSGARIGSGWALSRHWATGLSLTGLVTQGLSLSSFYSVKEGLLSFCFSQPVRGEWFRVLTSLKGGSLRKWKPSFSFFLMSLFFVASRNNPGFCRACLRIMVDPTPPTPTSGKTRLRAGVVGKLMGRRVTGLWLVSQCLETVAC